MPKQESERLVDNRLRKWRYLSENVPGNLHAAADWITGNHPEWDVVTMAFNGGNYTVVVYREAVQ